MEQTATAPPSPPRGEEGTSLVEFALIVTLLSTLLLGIVTFGILLSKRQVLTQAAAEGARAAVPYPYAAPYGAAELSTLKLAAEMQVNKSLQGVDRVCGVGGTTCDFVVYSCSGTASPVVTNPTGNGDCLQVTVTVPVKGSNPLAPSVSPITPFLPSTMSSKFTVTLANPT